MVGLQFDLFGIVTSVLAHEHADSEAQFTGWIGDRLATRGARGIDFSDDLANAICRTHAARVGAFGEKPRAWSKADAFEAADEVLAEWFVDEDGDYCDGELI